MQLETFNNRSLGGGLKELVTDERFSIVEAPREISNYQWIRFKILREADVFQGVW